MKLFFSGPRALTFIGILLLGLMPVSKGQESQQNRTDEDFKIRVAVEEVRIDTVVLNKKTRQPVSGLTARDFEVFQNDLPREIISCKYISEPTESFARPGISSGGDKKQDKQSKRIPPLPVTGLDREDVRRVIVFIVDDLSMDFENLHFARMGLKKFVEQQMQPGDLIAMLRTSYGNSALQVFLSDKQQLLARIETVEWGPNAGRIISEDTLQPLYEGQISAINYGIKALKDMPGRKALVVMTAQPELSSGMSGGGFSAVNYENLYLKQYNQLADDALRAGVVIHVLDIRGVEAPSSAMASSSPVSLTPTAMSGMGSFGGGGVGNLMGGGGSGGSGRSGGSGINYGSLQGGPTNVGSGGSMGVGSISNLGQGAGGMMGGGMVGMRGGGGGFSFSREPARQNSLPQKTGGLFIENKNFFLNGIGDVNNALKGYYLISFAPAPNSFKENRQAVYHRIKVNVKKSGVEWHTRDGFYGTTDVMEEAAAVPNAMRDAIFSPFQNYDLKLGLSSGYVKDPQSGYMLRSWLNVSAKDLQIVRAADGYAISLTTVCLTSDIKGYIHDSNMMKFEFGVKEENLEWIKENGIRFSLLLPIKKPGSYYLRVAVRDESSGKVGSAYEYVSIPDLNKGRLAMSNMFIINNADDVSWIWSGKTKEESRRLLAPVLEKEENKTPALRNYKPGESLEYMAIVYNAKLHNNLPDLESQYFLFRDGKEIMKGQPQQIEVGSLADFGRIPIRKKMMLGESMQEGNYVLQLVVRDKQDNGRYGLIAQTLNFEVKTN